MKWIMLGISLIIYELFFTPYRMCFDAPAKGVMFIFEIFVNLYFMVDLCLNFFISFRGDDGEVVLEHGVIMKKYLKGWFPIDLPASIPIDWIIYAIVSPEQEKNLASSSKTIRLIRVLRFVKMARILRVGRVGSFMDTFEQELVGSSWRMLGFAIGKIIIFLMFVAHISGCFWYLVGVNYEEQYGQSWSAGLIVFRKIKLTHR